MKSKAAIPQNVTHLVVLLAAALTLHLLPATASGQGFTFTYQGVLQDGGSPANGLYDLEFRVFDAASGGAQMGAQTTANDLPVTNGLFSVTIDPLTNVFHGAARWLNIAVRPGASAGAYTNLSPRQPLTPTPYAIHAAGANAAGLSGTVPAASIANNSITTAMLADGAVTSNKLATAVGQWSVSGANVFRASGNVAIGTNVAIARLEVVGNIAMNNGDLRFREGFDGNHGLGWYGTASLNKPFAGVDVDGPVLYGFASGGVGTKSGGERLAMVWKSNGNVGIGTTNPLAKLDVNGNGYFAGNVGIGTGSSIPADKLHVAGGLYMDTANARLRLQRTTGANYVDFNNGHPFHLRSIATNDSSANTRMTIDSAGRVGIGTTTPATMLDIAGEASMTACNITSDRNAKEGFKPVSAREVLEKVASLAITEWQYKQQPGVRHIGPVAQDFREAFGVGRDEKHITTVDADGVALAAIQGLNEKVEAREARIRELEKMVMELKQAVDRLAPSAR